MHAILETLCTTIMVVNLVITKELPSIYLDKQTDNKVLDTAEIATYLAILGGGLLMWNFMNQHVEFESKLLGAILKKVFNGLTH